EYLGLLQSRSDELAALYRDMLIGVTTFFRDGEPLEQLRSQVFAPLIARRRADAPIRVWVPGCSTGEEAYSVAMLLCEALGDDASRRRVQVFATDVDLSAVQTARRGVYPASIAVDVSSERLRRFFTPLRGGYQISRAIRDMVVFAPHDLLRDPPFSRLDLVSC